MRRLVILLVGLLFMPAAVDAHSIEVIHMTKDGFQPQSLTIEAGETVTFFNDDTQPHWPASNIHPTHHVYPGSGIEKSGTSEQENIFDACHGLLQGKSWSFTFKYVGTWRMHDHLEAAHTGSITVTGTSTAPSPSEAKTASFRDVLHRVGSGIYSFFLGLIPGAKVGY